MATFIIWAILLIETLFSQDTEEILYEPFFLSSSLGLTLLFFGGIVVGIFGYLLLTSRTAFVNPILGLVMLIFALISYLGLFWARDSTFSIYYLLCVVCGIANAFLSCIIVQLLSNSYKEVLRDNLIVSIAAGAGAAFMLTLLPAETWVICSPATLILSGIGYLSTTISLKEGIWIGENKAFGKFDRHSLIPMTITGFSFGIGLFLLWNTQDNLASVQHLFFALAIAFPALVWLFSVAMGAEIKESLAVKIMLPATVSLFVLVFQPSPIVQGFAGFGLVALAVFNSVLSLCTLCKYSLAHELALSRLFGLAIIQVVITVALGLLFMIGLNYLSMDARNIAWIVLVIALVIALSISSRMITYPGEEAMLCYNVNDCPLRMLKGGDGSESDAPHSKGDDLEKKCIEIALTHDLTLRQRETLLLLAKGRNANYIAEQFVISPNTARSHIYAIFAKLNVHSHQELMSLVDEWKPLHS